jgi:hypothetical protein
VEGLRHTPIMFEQSGFVEPYPKRWIVQEVRLPFDVMVLDDQRGTLDAKFAVPSETMDCSGSTVTVRCDGVGRPKRNAGR